MLIVFKMVEILCCSAITIKFSSPYLHFPFSFHELAHIQKVRSMALEDVVILNVDTNTLETPFDDLQSLPNDVVCME